MNITDVRARFSALDQPLIFFDGPGGTQVPDTVIDAIAGYLRGSNANTGGHFPTSVRTDALIETARETASRFLGAHHDEVAFGPSTTALNFRLTRALGRELAAGDEILVTKLDHDANVSPWLELARDRDLTVHFVDVRDDTSLDLDQLESLLSGRTRVVAFPLASNAVGTKPDAHRLVELEHGAGALAWADAVHYAPHEPIDAAALGVDVLLCSPYKFFGPHLGLAFGRRDLLERWRAYKVRPAAEEPVGHRFETGTLPHELLAGFVAAVGYVEELGWDAIRAQEQALGQRFLDGLPEQCTLWGLPTMEGRVPTFAFTVRGRTADEAARILGEAGFAVSQGNYYALEIMRRLGLDPDGAVRAGFIHYNTLDEVDRFVAELARL
ncbi:MAG: cysteine desulfurase-like protein [Gaiellaceae bacterium]